MRYYEVLEGGVISITPIPLPKRLTVHHPVDIIYYLEQVGGISAVLWSDGTPVFPRK